MSQSGSIFTNSGAGGFVQTINGAVPLAGNINLTSTGATIIITPGANTVNLEVAAIGGVASVTGGSNINLTGTATNPIINLNNSPSVSGTLTAATGLIATTGGVSSVGITSFTGGAFGVGIDATDNAINIGTVALAGRTTNIGNATGTSPLILKSGTGASSFQPTGTGSLAIGTTNTGTINIGNTTGATTIQFGTGSALSNFTDWTAWTPTIDGSTPGTTTYTIQDGLYSRIGNIVVAQFRISITAATGTGNATIGGFPFVVNNTDTNYIPQGTVRLSSTVMVWPVTTTMLTLQGINNTITATILGTGSGVTSSNVQMANTTAVIFGTLIYRA